jgi:hypothetical protein
VNEVAALAIKIRKFILACTWPEERYNPRVKALRRARITAIRALRPPRHRLPRGSLLTSPTLRFSRLTIMVPRQCKGCLDSGYVGQKLIDALTKESSDDEV